VDPVSARGYVYLAASEPLHAVKIGWSLRPETRIKDLGVANPCIELLAYFPSPRSIEKTFHAIFKDLRFSGEWFLVDDRSARQELIDAFIGCMVWSHIAHGEPAFIAPQFKEAYQPWHDLAESVRIEVSIGPN
jgi:hypothetical protein